MRDCLASCGPMGEPVAQRAQYYFGATPRAASDHLQPVSPQSVTLGPGSCAAQPTQPMSRRNPRSAWPSVLGVKFVRHHELGQVCVPSAQRGPVVRKRKDCDGGCRVLGPHPA